MSAGKKFKELASEEVRKKAYDQAIRLYLSAIYEFEKQENKTHEIAKCHSNIGLCYFKFGKYEKSIEHAEECIKLEFFKGYLRKSRALSRLKRYEDSALTLLESLSIFPIEKFSQSDLKCFEVLQRLSRFFTHSSVISKLESFKSISHPENLIVIDSKGRGHGKILMGINASDDSALELGVSTKKYRFEDDIEEGSDQSSPLCLRFHQPVSIVYLPGKYYEFGCSFKDSSIEFCKIELEDKNNSVEIHHHFDSNYLSHVKMNNMMLKLVLEEFREEISKNMNAYGFPNSDEFLWIFDNCEVNIRNLSFYFDKFQTTTNKNSVLLLLKSTSKDTTIEDCEFENKFGKCLLFSGLGENKNNKDIITRITIDRCNFKNCLSAGVTASKIQSASPFRISSCRFQKCDVGVFCHHTRNLELDSNVFDMTKHHSIEITESCFGGKCEVRNNKLNSQFFCGMRFSRIQREQEVIVEDNQIGETNHGNAITIENVKKISVLGNSLQNHKLGVKISGGSEVDLLRNQFANCVSGIVVFKNSGSKVLVEDNTFSYCSEFEIQVCKPNPIPILKNNKLVVFSLNQPEGGQDHHDGLRVHQYDWKDAVQDKHVTKEESEEHRKRLRKILEENEREQHHMGDNENLITTCMCCSMIENKTISRFARCGRCKNVYYCSKKCQIKHWKVHKKDCHKF